MTAFTGSINCSPARLAVTRGGLHRVAEHVLAAGLCAASGEIGLVPAPGGFRTPPFGPDGRFLAVDGTELVTGDAAATRRTALTTLRAVTEAAAFFRDGRARTLRRAS
jgi:enamine deaminase RidA (YjgF/YER057c/UK114 family)